MKKIFFLLLLLAGTSLLNDVSAQKTRFYYYPSANVYYNPATSQYIYPAASGWTTVSSLPASYRVNKASRVTVYSETPQVWSMNSQHKTKYKVTPAPKGKAVGYKGSNANRAQGETKVITRTSSSTHTNATKGKSSGNGNGKAKNKG